ncbi:hypothetical protein ABPG75_007247 [Micractinium tetrahymenae]
MHARLPSTAAIVPPAVAVAAWPQRQRRKGTGPCLRHPCRAAATGEPSDSASNSGSLLRRAQQLREARQRLEEEAAALAAAEGLSPAERLALLEALGLPAPPDLQHLRETRADRPAVQQGAQSSIQPPAAAATAAGGEPPAPGSAAWRAQLPPHLQGFLADTGLAAVLDHQAEAVRKEQEWGTAEEQGGADMEAVARTLEEGGDLPPLPEGTWDGEAEAPAEFLARLQGSIDYTNADLKGSRHAGRQQAGASELPPGAEGGAAEQGQEASEGAARRAAARRAAAQHTLEPAALEAAVRYSLEPALAAAYAQGWEQAKEVDRLWDSREFQNEPLVEELGRSTPAPPLPPDAERVFRSAERIAYVMRRGHLESRSPEAAVLALQGKGLVSEDFVLQDPFVVRGSLGSALDYLRRLSRAGATLTVSSLMLKCTEYRPLPKFTVQIDCFIDFPFPDWFYGWAVLNHGASSAAARRAAPSAGPYSSVSAAAIAAAEAAGEAARDREDDDDAALVEGMVVAAHKAAEQAGQQLDEAALVQVMRAAARICLDRRERKEAAAQEAAAAGVRAARDANEAAARRSPRELAAALAAAAAGQLAHPELVEVQSARYEHEGEKRRHTWVMMDWGEQHRQLGRQLFQAYPKQPDSEQEEVEEGEEEEKEEEPAWLASQAAYEAEQRRRYGLVPAAGLTEPEWGRLEWIAARAREQPGWLQQLQQDAQQPAAAQQQQQQQQQPGSGDSGRGFGSGGGGKKGRRRRGKAKGQDAADAAAAGAAEQLQAEQEQEEELFPFTYDWDKQRRRRNAGEILRILLGDNFDRAMAQLPQRGRTRGRGSNSALEQQAEQEGTAWLGGECMTVQATFSYTIDPDRLQVDTCGIVWGAVHGLQLHELSDAWDIWLEATGLLHDAECEQDAAEAAELGQAAARHACSWVPRWRL